MSPLAIALKKLLEQPGGVPASGFSTNQRRELESFVQRTGAARFERRGSGGVFRVHAPEVLEQHLTTLSPDWRSTLDPNLPARSHNIALTRSSKLGASRHDVYHLLLKPVGTSAAWTSGGAGQAHLVEDLARPTGAAVIPVSPDDHWSTTGDLWLVENQAMFDQLSWLPEGAQGSVSYFAGEIHGTLLRWLAARPRARQVIVFPDYDGNGLSCFLRVAAASAAPCQLYLFEGWAATLERYGNPALHRANLPALEAAANSDVPAVIREQIQPLVNLMAGTGKALEQEAVWLSPGAVTRTSGPVSAK